MSSEGIVKIIKSNDLYYLEVDKKLLMHPFGSQTEAREYADKTFKIVGGWNLPPSPKGT